MGKYDDLLAPSIPSGKYADIVQPMGKYGDIVEDQGAFSAFGKQALQGAIPAAAGLAAAVPAAQAGAAIGAPLGPVGVIGGGLIGGLVGMLGASWGTSKLQDYGIEAMIGKEKHDQMLREAAQAREQHPVASFAGELAPQLLFFNPTKGAAGAVKAWNFLKDAEAMRKGIELAKTIPKTPEAISAFSKIPGNAGKYAEWLKFQDEAQNTMNVVFGAGTQAAAEGWNQIQEGDFQPLRLAASIAAGALLNDPNAIGKRIMRIKTPTGLPPAPVGPEGGAKFEAQPVVEAPIVPEAAAPVEAAPAAEPAPTTEGIKTSHIPEENKRVVTIDGKEYVFVKRGGKYVEVSTPVADPATPAEIEAKIQDSFPIKQPAPTVPTTADALASSTDVVANDLTLRTYLMDQGVPAKTLAAMKTDELKAMVNDANAIRDASVLAEPKPEPELKPFVPETEETAYTVPGMTKRGEKQVNQDARNQKRADEEFAAREQERQIQEAQFRATRYGQDEEPAPYLEPGWKAERGAIGREPRLTDEAKARIKDDVKAAKQALKEPDELTHEWEANPLMRKIKELGGIRMYDSVISTTKGKKRYFQEEMKRLPKSVRSSEETGGLVPDKMLMALQEEGFLLNVTKVDEMFDAIYKTGKQMTQESWWGDQAKVEALWVKDKSQPIHLSKLEYGAEFKIKGEHFRVVEQGESATHVKDGTDYWIPHENEYVRIDKGSLETPIAVAKRKIKEASKTEEMQKAEAFAQKAKTRKAKLDEQAETKVKVKTKAKEGDPVVKKHKVSKKELNDIISCGGA